MPESAALLARPACLLRIPKWLDDHPLRGLGGTRRREQAAAMILAVWSARRLIRHSHAVESRPDRGRDGALSVLADQPDPCGGAGHGTGHRPGRRPGQDGDPPREDRQLAWPGQAGCKPARPAPAAGSTSRRSTALSS
jgi:hypothetical protein